MDQLRTLLLRFKDLEGDAAESSSNLSQDVLSNFEVRLGFHNLASYSTHIYDKLAATAVFGSLAGELLNELEALHQLLVDAQTQVLDVNKLIQLLRKSTAAGVNLFKELQNPSRKESAYMILLFHFSFRFQRQHWGVH